MAYVAHLEDQPIWQKLISMMLISEGHSYDAVTNLEDFIAMDASPDVIFLDGRVKRTPTSSVDFLLPESISVARQHYPRSYLAVMSLDGVAGDIAAREGLKYFQKGVFTPGDLIEYLDSLKQPLPE